MKNIIYLFILIIFSISVFAQNLSFVDITSEIKDGNFSVDSGKTPFLLDDKNTMVKVTSLVILLLIIMWIVSYRVNHKRMHRDL